MICNGTSNFLPQRVSGPLLFLRPIYPRLYVDPVADCFRDLAVMGPREPVAPAQSWDP